MNERKVTLSVHTTGLLHFPYILQVYKLLLVDKQVHAATDPTRVRHEQGDKTQTYRVSRPHFQCCCPLPSRNAYMFPGRTPPRSGLVALSSTRRSSSSLSPNRRSPVSETGRAQTVTTHHPSCTSGYAWVVRDK